MEKAKALKEGMLEMLRLWNDMNFDVFEKMLLGVDARPTVKVNAVIEGAVGEAASGASTSEGAVGEAMPKVACAKCGRCSIRSTACGCTLGGTARGSRPRRWLCTWRWGSQVRP